MGDKTTMEFVAGKNSSALIRNIANELRISEEEVVQKGITFMKLYAGLKSKGGRILVEEKNGKTREIMVIDEDNK